MSASYQLRWGYHRCRLSTRPVSRRPGRGRAEISRESPAPARGPDSHVPEVESTSDRVAHQLPRATPSDGNQAIREQRSPGHRHQDVVLREPPCFTAVTAVPPVPEEHILTIAALLQAERH